MRTAPDHASLLARDRLQQPRCGPLFYADWLRTVMIHLRLSHAALQPYIPFELDRLDGDAWVTLVAFSQENLRPVVARSTRGRRTAGLQPMATALARPLAQHDFLNLRTYVRHRGEVGIFFIAEVLSSRLAVLLGPLMYGLPYRFGRLDYHNDLTAGPLQGAVQAAGAAQQLIYTAVPVDPGAKPQVSRAGSADAFLMERYVAFTARGGVRRRFRIWHEPWRQVRVAVELTQADLCAAAGPWWPQAHLAFANASPGVRDVWIGRPEIL